MRVLGQSLDTSGVYPKAYDALEFDSQILC